MRILVLLLSVAILASFQRYFKRHERYSAQYSDGLPLTLDDLNKQRAHGHEVGEEP